ncbi:MAG: FtsX-like permease family protein [Treponema sp.]|nr:FtsX-like permease family protein [Treponema sp.]
MIKKARFLNIFRTIKGSLNRFFAISAIVALGAGFLGGLEATSVDMEAAADSYMDKYDWYDLDIVNHLAFTQSEIQKVQNISQVDKIQKAIVSDDVFLTSEGNRLTVRVFALLPDDGQVNMNRFELKEGNFPSQDDECLLQITGLYSASLPKIGEELKVLQGTGSNYKYKSVKVSGIVQSPMFFTAEMEPSTKGSGSLEMAIYVRPDFYINQNFNHLYLTVKGAAQLDTWSSEYKKLVQNVREEIQQSLKDEIYSRFDSFQDSSKAISKVFDKAQLADEKLQSAEFSAIPRNSQVIGILKNQKAQNELLSALTLENQLIKNNQDRSDFSKAKKSVDSLFEKFAVYRENIFSVENRSQSTGYSSYKDNIEKIASLSKVFPAFFFFIALLVALTTMTRLVEEKRSELGTLKSLGFSSYQLLGQYLFYAFIFSLLGCAIGLTIGFKLFPTAVSLSYSMMYTIPLGKMPFRWNIALPVSAIAIGVILIATAAACFSETLARPAVLMSPKAPRPGKRILLEYISFIWNKLNFSRKVTVRNMFRYKRRLWMTLAGVAGCSALLVAGFGLRDSLQDIITIQFDDLSIYNISLMLDDSAAFEEDQIVNEFLKDKSKVSDWIQVAGENVIVKNGEKSLGLTLYVPKESQRIDDFMVMRNRKGHEKISLDGDGIVITEKQTEILGVKSGDFVTIQNEEGIEKSVKLLAANECYMYGNVYASEAEYVKLFGKKPEYKAALCNLTPEKNNQETVTEVMKSPHVIYAMWIDSLLESAHKTIASIDIVVFVVIITSGLLSIIVLYNLANINICERKREIATLLVLGYTEKEARQYIFREINLLSLLGTIIGLFLGGPLHAIVVHATEVNAIMWGRSVHPLSYLYAFVVSLIFTLLVNLMMKKSITKIDMVESLKTKD